MLHHPLDTRHEIQDLDIHGMLQVLFLSVFHLLICTKQVALCLGCVGEALGYVGRIMLNDDPFDSVGFQIQICCLIISPAFISAGIYVTLKHVVINFGEEWSRLRPSWYTYIFITADLLSLVLQGAGGGIAATADSGSEMLDIGTDLMIAGVVFQVVALAVFGYFLAEYTLRTYRRRDRLSAESMELYHNTKFRCYMGAVMLAYLTIFTRCVYRIPELTGGWRSELMREEMEFIILEGVMIVIAVAVMTVFHPGYCFPALSNAVGKNDRMLKAKSMESDVEMMSMREEA